MDALELNEILETKTIARVEPGTTPGWIVLFLENNDPSLIDNEGKPVELYMTIFVGGSKFDREESLHYSNCGLHLRTTDGRFTCHSVRDYSTPMPIAAADPITLKSPAHCDAPDVGPRSRYGHCTNRVAENGMLCQEHYEKSQLCHPANGNKALTA
jgi:hypothetical protein